MKTKHTPGPWKVLEIKNDKELMFIVKSEERMIGSFHGFYSDADDKLKADANLLAAAPEMLEALDYAQECIEKGIKSDDFLWQLDALIKKARGE